MDRKHKGAHSELIACAFLLAAGYEVFRNVSQHGSADVVAFKDGEMFKFDIKTVSGTYHDGSPVTQGLSPEQIKENVKAVHVLPSGQCIIDLTPRLKGDGKFGKRWEKIPPERRREIAKVANRSTYRRVLSP